MVTKNNLKVGFLLRQIRKEKRMTGDTLAENVSLIFPLCSQVFFMASIKCDFPDPFGPDRMVKLGISQVNGLSSER